MFAYCGNNPTNNTDPTGHAFWGTNTVAVSDGFCGFYPGSAEHATRERKRQEKWTTFHNAITNEDPETALDGGLLSFYKGVLVLNLPFEWTAFSYGIIVMGSQYKSDAYGVKTINHEYGHYLQLQEYGFASYTMSIAIPSVICNRLDYYDLLPWSYYSSPWEYEADALGGVYRDDYEPWSATISDMYSFIRTIGLIQ